MEKQVSRWGFAARWAGTHALLSMAVAALSAWLVFGLLYPDPWRQMLGVGAIFALVVSVDVVCGPLLTFVLANPKKSRRELWLDLSLVALIQLAALGYGLWSVYSARPVVLAFEVDRFVVITANELWDNEMQDAPSGLRTLPMTGLLRVAVRSANSAEEQMQSIESSLQGVSPSMRPSWWVPVEEARAGIDQRAQPLAALIAKRPEQKAIISAAAQKTEQSISSLRYLPLTSSKGLDWIALVDGSGSMVGYAHVGGFE